MKIQATFRHGANGLPLPLTLLLALRQHAVDERTGVFNEKRKSSFAQIYATSGIARRQAASREIYLDEYSKGFFQAGSLEALRR
jgi:hypothetical protein